MQVKGMAMNARLSYVRKNFGPDGEKKLFEKLPKLKDMLFGEEFLPSKMFQYNDYIAINQTVADLFFHGKDAGYIALGEDSANSALGTVHKAFVTARDVKSFVRSLPIIYNAYYKDLGQATTVVDAMENKATASVTGVKYPHRSLCQIIYGYLKKGMELCGAKNVKLNEKLCLCNKDSECTFEITWE